MGGVYRETAHAKQTTELEWTLLCCAAAVQGCLQASWNKSLHTHRHIHTTSKISSPILPPSKMTSGYLGVWKKAILATESSPKTKAMPAKLVLPLSVLQKATGYKTCHGGWDKYALVCVSGSEKACFLGTCNVLRLTQTDTATACSIRVTPCPEDLRFCVANICMHILHRTNYQGKGCSHTLLLHN